MPAKSNSSKKIVEENDSKIETPMAKGKKKSVIVTEVSEVMEPLELHETEKVVEKMPEQVSADEIVEELRELRPKEGKKIVVGPSRLTRFEKARIIGIRALQLSLGAPLLIAPLKGVVDSISIGEAELMQKALPISLRRILPNGKYQDIPISWLLEN